MIVQTENLMFEGFYETEYIAYANVGDVMQT